VFLRRFACDRVHLVALPRRQAGVEQLGLDCAELDALYHRVTVAVGRLAQRTYWLDVIAQVTAPGMARPPRRHAGDQRMIFTDNRLVGVAISRRFIRKKVAAIVSPAFCMLIVLHSNRMIIAIIMRVEASYEIQ